MNKLDFFMPKQAIYKTIHYLDLIIRIFEYCLVIKIWPNIESNTLIQNSTIRILE